MAGIRVLLIDDEPELLEVSKRYLEISKGFTIYACDSAFEALDVLRREEFDVIVSDYQMPRMDGLQFLKALRESGNATQFILFTGKGREDVVVTALNLGATFYLQKGGDFRAQFAELSNMIRRAAETTRSAAELRRSESKFRNYIENSPEGIAVVDSEGRCLEVNTAFCLLTGHAEAELIGRSVKALDPDRSSEESASPFNIIKGTNTASYDSPYVRKDGALRYWHIDAVRLEDGRLIGFHSDITLKKELMDQALWRERMLEHMASFNPLGVLMIDQQNEQLIYSNKRFYSIWGLPQPEEDPSLVGIDAKVLLRRCLEKVKDPQEYMARVRRGMVEEGRESSEDEIEMADDRILRRVFTKVRDHEGNYLGRFYVFEDITLRRREEEWLRDQEEVYRTLYESSGDAILLADNGVIIAGNRQAIALFGAEDEAALCRLHLSDISPPLQPDGQRTETKIMDVNRRLAEQGTALFTWTHQRVDGTKFPAMVRITSMKIGGRPVQQGIIRDLSEHESLKLALEETNEELRIIFDSVSDAIFLMDMDGRIIDVNQPALDLFNVSREEALRMSPGRDLSDPSLASAFSERVLAKARSEENHAFQWRSRRPRDGSVFESEGYLRRVMVHGQPAILCSVRNISGRKKAEAELRQHAARMSILYEIISIGSQAPDLAAIAGRSTEMVMGALGYDAAALYLVDETGRYADLVVSKGIVDERALLRCPIDQQPYDQVFAKGEPIFSTDYSSLRIKGGGTHGFTTAACVPLPSEKGVIGSLNMARRSAHGIDDEERSILMAIGRELGTVVERRRALRRAETEQENMQSLFDSIVDMVFVLDLKGEIIEVNGRACGMLGYRREEMIGNSVAMLHDPEFRGRAGQIISDMAAGLRNQCPMDVRTKDGRRVTVETIVTRGSWNGEPCLIGTTRDITEKVAAEEALRNSEEKYRLLVENAAEAVTVIQDGVFRYANDRVCEMTGYGMGEIIGHPIIDLACPEDKVAMMRGHLDRQAGKGPNSHMVRILTKEGTIKWFDCKTACIEWDGRPATLNLYSDVTERLRNEEALRQANRQLNLMSSITRHDILNSITVMMGLLELARREEATQTPEMQRTLEKLRHHTKLIQSHVEFTRVYQDIGSRSPQWQDLGAMLSRLRLPLGMKIDVDCHGVEVLADPMLEKVFANLIDNTIRHGVRANRVRVNCQPSSMGMDIIYEDDGVGVPADEKDHIFEYGYGRNTGLGLFLAREILSITQMRIRENGQEGNGARFEIHVPKGSYRKPGKCPGA